MSERSMLQAANGKGMVISLGTRAMFQYRQTTKGCQVQICRLGELEVNCSGFYLSTLLTPPLPFNTAHDTVEFESFNLTVFQCSCPFESVGAGCVSGTIDSGFMSKVLDHDSITSVPGT